MNADMKDRAVVVTGGARGIGRGIARVFGAAGAKVLIVDLDRADAERTATEIREAGGTATSLVADVTSAADVRNIAAASVKAHGGLDVLCSNVGIFPSASLESMTEEQWDEVQTVNLKSLFLVVQACLPELKKSSAGRVVMTSSITGPITGYSGWTHYGATKAGMLGFMRTAALELAPHQITINAVMPGNIRTEGLADLGDEYIRIMERAVPLGRLGTPEDIGHAMLFLASPQAGYITGQTLVVDGGQVLPESPEAMAQ